ncbi:MAG: hypothetical protein A2736_01855 [Candidatus Yanofskybacteria bacterium RIFCSPHIGHO2_01_FULL_41_27]|uniref:Uncharacterized protein n=2 Tax=Candidatus Yanofskyibacteriota TaxID=1752733 RepID=A0A1F8HUT3_9BACT|nr:MAG: hypothetical protein A2736_01855 [Candidatus Yanofskybacteria bacterium RIFCSPHIGHO2_01_FULL_41_27]OGN10336.1 MAG: hypothetical protein A3C64_00375 [Candidatus Yanofskybacteria bacterium RIFCSPHIGHO2_02_FULL_41_12]OGN41341.1 MAG: hypothetical protein A2606_02175 [Candidatus Yanofskybacteria bacterium RIFOXYD1_FULL_42_10]
MSPPLAGNQAKIPAKVTLRGAADSTKCTIDKDGFFPSYPSYMWQLYKPNHLVIENFAGESKENTRLFVRVL